MQASHTLQVDIDDARWVLSWLDKVMPPCLIATTVPVAWSATSPVLLIAGVAALVVLNLWLSRLTLVKAEVPRQEWRLMTNACLVGGLIWLAGPAPGSWLLIVPWALPAMMFELKFGLTMFGLMVLVAAVCGGLAGVPVRAELSGYLALLFLGTILLVTANALRGRALALRVTVAQLREAMAAKETFLATMSHELRTPMNGVIGMTEILSESELSAEQREYLSTIRSCGRSLLALINDILDLSKIEAGAVQLEAVTFDVVALASDVLSMTGATAAEKGLELKLSDAPDALWVEADPHRLRQILTNLVGNATKFTPEGSVTLVIRRITPEQIRIEVRDTGIGIPEDKQEVIFNLFSQADESTTRSFGGTGLGLSITRELVELFGGRIGLDSQVGTGTTFWLELPWQAVEPEPDTSTLPIIITQPSPEPVQQPTPGARPLVLVVEDNPVNRLVAGRLLQRMNLDVEMANDGLEGVEKFECGRFAAILMDLQMPNLDGLGATERIRSLEADSAVRTPIIAVTASILVADLAACQAAGMDAVLGKPIVVDTLKSTLASYGVIGVAPAQASA